MLQAVAWYIQTAGLVGAVTALLVQSYQPLPWSYSSRQRLSVAEGISMAHHRSSTGPPSRTSSWSELDDAAQPKTSPPEEQEEEDEEEKEEEKEEKKKEKERCLPETSSPPIHSGQLQRRQSNGRGSRR